MAQTPAQAPTPTAPPPDFNKIAAQIRAEIDRLIAAGDLTDEELAQLQQIEEELPDPPTSKGFGEGLVDQAFTRLGQTVKGAVNLPQMLITAMRGGPGAAAMYTTMGQGVMDDAKQVIGNATAGTAEGAGRTVADLAAMLVAPKVLGAAGGALRRGSNAMARGSQMISSRMRPAPPAPAPAPPAPLLPHMAPSPAAPRYPFVPEGFNPEVAPPIGEELARLDIGVSSGMSRKPLAPNVNPEAPFSLAERATQPRDTLGGALNTLAADLAKRPKEADLGPYAPAVPERNPWAGGEGPPITATPGMSLADLQRWLQGLEPQSGIKPLAKPRGR